MKKKPQDGGCWYCHTDDAPITFSWEFDTYIHEKCIIKQRDAVSNGYLDGYDPENEIFLREFGLYE